MEVDWDLHAVVRGCNTSSSNVTTTTTTATTTASFKADFDSQSWFSSFNSEQSSHLCSLADRFEARNAIEELHELYKPFFPNSQPISPPTSISSKSISSSLSSISTPSKNQTQFKQQQKQQQQQLKQSHGGSVTSSTTANSHPPRSKRRKNQLKRICHVPAEGLSSDVWAWRKYGQKPIKGSPYPRGYYRCSSSKGCLARKQVERNRSDPSMFVVTYTAEHNHPAPTHKNSLAGTTRQKPFTPQNMAASESNKPPSPTSSGKPTFSSSSPATSMEEETVPQSTNTESRELDLLEDVEEEEFGVSDIGISDDFFVGLEGLGSEESLTDRFPASFGLPWVANNAATTAAGGI